MGTPSDSELTQATGKVNVETISQRLSKMCNQSWVRAGEENVVVRCVCVRARLLRDVWKKWRWGFADGEGRYKGDRPEGRCNYARDKR
jgi:hypothetical protein